MDKRCSWGSQALWPALGALGVLLVALAGCGKQELQKTEAPPPAVTVARPLRQTVAVYGEYVGQMDSPQTVELRARLDGYIKEIAFEEGQEVEKGALMFVIDPEPYVVALNTAKAQLEVAQAQVKVAAAALEQAQNVKDKEVAQTNLTKADAELINANQNLTEMQAVVAANAMNRSQLEAAEARQKQAVAGVEGCKQTLAQATLDFTTRVDQAKANLAQAKANVSTANTQVDQAALNLKWTRIESPVKGRVGLQAVKVGALVGHNGDPTLLATVSLVDPIYVTFSVSERAAFELKKFADEKKQGKLVDGSPVRMVLEDGRLYGPAGKINFIDRTLDPGTGTLTLRAEFPNPDRFLRPGNFAHVRMILTEKPNALLVTERALGADQGGWFLKVVDKDGTVVQRPVKIGAKQDGLVVIEEGLKADEQVVVKGLQRARPGIKVTPELEKTVAAAPPAAAGKTTQPLAQQP